MLAAITLLPATLAVAGRRIKPAKAAALEPDGRFYRLARRVQRRPAAVAGVVGLVLVLFGLPFLHARFENGDARSLPRSSEVRATALTLADRFPSRGADPITLIAAARPTDPRLLAWVHDLAQLDGAVDVSLRPGAPEGPTVVDVVPTGTAQGSVAKAIVNGARATHPDFAFDVGGPAAELLDVKAKLTARLPLAGLVVGLATLVLLFLMTGSLVVPIKAVIMNVLSLGATFGALAWIFQDGHLAGLLGFDSVGALDLWMPVLIVIFAFGLSMDYEVFLLARIKEIHDHTGDNDYAVAAGLQRSGRIITAAAGLIVVVFAGFAAGEVLAIKQLGVGLAIAVIVDAALVRTLLVPATMKLLGERNWWAPAPLRRFHARFGLHEAPAAPAAAVGSAAYHPVTGA
jgi:RND superfamily putative drug exporter